MALNFGVGCITFETNTGGSGSYRKWPDRVKKALDGVPTVRNVHVKIGDGFVSGRGSVLVLTGEPIGDEEFDYESTLTFDPQPASGSVEFDITIAERFQRELAMDSWCGSEEFHVRIVYGHMPVCFVTVDSTSPATALVVLRKFLRRELERTSDGPVVLGELGPSPMHFDFILIPSTDPAAADMTFNRVHRLGYDDVEVTYNSTTFVTRQSALEEAQRRLHEELALYYQCRAISLASLIQSQEASERLEDLLALHESKGLFAAIKRFFSSGRRARDLALDLIGLRFTAESWTEFLGRQIREHYEHNKQPVFQDIVTVELAGEPRVRFTEETLGLLETRRTRENELAILIAASLVGGLVGAGLTAVLT